MPSSPTATEAGWHPDPNQEGRERLWDGERWTDYVRRADPTRDEPQLAGWYDDPNDEAQERLWSGDHWTPYRRPTGAAGEAAEATTEPGWYDDPRRPGRERYWDGEQWTNRLRTGAGQPEAKDEPAIGWIIVSYIAALVIPLAGLFIGAGVLRPRGSKHWIPVVVLSALNIPLSILLASI